MIGTPWHNLVPVKVIESEPVDDDSEDGRWRYTVQVVKFGASVLDVPDVPTIPGPPPGEEEGGGPVELKAYNMYEYANTQTSHMGIDPSTLPGSFELKPIPNDTIVPAFISNGRADDANATRGVMVLLLWPNQFSGACNAVDLGGGGGGSSALVQSFSGTWSGQYQYNGTVGTNTETVIDLSIGAERWGANKIRFWNGSEALNAGATTAGTRYVFATGADCRTWWDAYVIRVNVNNEGWQYINATNSGTTTVGGSCQAAYINTSPAVSWTRSDFSAGLAMDVEVYKLSLGGGP